MAANSFDGGATRTYSNGHGASNGTSANGTATLPDSLRGSSCWHESAPGPLQQLAAVDVLEEGWSLWRDHLGQKHRPTPLTALGRKDDPYHALRWARVEEARGDAVDELLTTLATVHNRKLRSATAVVRCLDRYLDRAPACHARGEAFEALAWGTSLVPLAAHLSAAQWWVLLDRLIGLARDGGRLQVSSDPLTQQWLGGELGLYLGLTLPELQASRELVPVAVHCLSAGMQAVLDNAGLAKTPWLPLARPLLATWTRAATVAAELPDHESKQIRSKRFGRAVQQAIRLSRRDGSAMLVDSMLGSRYDNQFDEALLAAAHEQLCGRRQRRTPAPGRLASNKKSKADIGPSTHGAEAGVALLRCDWSRNSPRLAVHYPQGPTWSDSASPSLALELSLGSDVVLAGDWQCELSIDGVPCTQTSPWQETLWSSDEDADYLELQADFGDAIKVQRHLMLARQDDCLFLADAIRSNDETSQHQIRYRARLATGAGIETQAAEEVTEIIVRGKKQRAVVLPLALSEWKSDSRFGKLLVDDGALVLEQRGQGQALMAPLWFALKEDYDEAITWRQLTVAEALLQQPRDRAVGYRVQVGKRQWLVYRSLTKPANRTLLGHNLSTEFLVARFRKGDVSTLIEVE